MSHSNYMWAVDGFGRVFIVTRDTRNPLQVLLCMIDGGGQLGVWILEDQEE